MSSSNCCFLDLHTEFSGGRSGGLESHLLKNFPDAHKDFGIVNKSEVDACLGEGNGTPLQHSCLENPMDGGAW